MEEKWKTLSKTVRQLWMHERIFGHQVHWTDQMPTGAWSQSGYVSVDGIALVAGGCPSYYTDPENTIRKITERLKSQGLQIHTESATEIEGFQSEVRGDGITERTMEYLPKLDSVAVAAIKALDRLKTLQHPKNF